MIVTQTSDKQIIMSQDLNSDQMTISRSKMGMIAEVLRNHIYSDKTGAVIRETVCNAIDEHRKHRISVPVRIELKNKVFSVRDYAKGLSDYDVKNVLLSYLASTKSDTNDDIGGYGVGAIAPLCYADSFTVTSFFAGKKTTYIVARGKTDIQHAGGSIVTVSEEPTDETGIMVQVDVNSVDEHVFNTKILNILQWTNDSIEYYYNSDAPKHSAVPSEIREFDGIRMKIYNCESDTGYHGGDYACVTMGGIAYRIPSRPYMFSISANSVSFNTKFRVSFEVPVGTMTVGISRENFDDTPTNNLVLDKIQEFYKQLQESALQERMNELGIFDFLSRLTGVSNYEWANKSIFSVSTRYMISEKYSTHLFPRVRLMNADGSFFNGNIDQTIFDKLHRNVDGKIVFLHIGPKMVTEQFAKIASSGRYSDTIFLVHDKKLMNLITVKECPIIDQFIFRNLRHKEYKFLETKTVKKNANVVIYEGAEFVEKYANDDESYRILYEHYLNGRSVKYIDTFHYDKKDKHKKKPYLGHYLGEIASKTLFISDARFVSEFIKKYPQYVKISTIQGDEGYDVYTKCVEEIETRKSNAQDLINLQVYANEFNFSKNIRNTSPKHVNKLLRVMDTIRDEDSLRGKIFRKTLNQKYSYSKNPYSRKELRDIMSLK